MSEDTTTSPKRVNPYIPLRQLVDPMGSFPHGPYKWSSTVTTNQLPTSLVWLSIMRRAAIAKLFGAPEDAIEEAYPDIGQPSRISIFENQKMLLCPTTTGTFSGDLGNTGTLIEDEERFLELMAEALDSGWDAPKEALMQTSGISFSECLRKHAEQQDRE